MAPSSVESRETRMEGVEEDEVLCKQCMGRGERNALRYLQINDEVAVFVCDEEKCTSLPSLAPGSQLVVERRAADFTYLRRRKRRATSLPSSNCNPPAANPKSTSVLESDRTLGDSVKQPRVSDNQAKMMVVSPLPALQVLQWPSEGRLCWLDVSMLLLVQCGSLRRCHQALGATSLLRQLCDGFDEAQSMAANGLLSGQTNKTSASGADSNIRRHSIGQTHSQTQGQLSYATEADNSRNLLNGRSFFDFLDADNTGVTLTTDAIHQQLDAMHLSNPSGQTTEVKGDTLNTISSNLAAAIDLLRKKRQELFEAIKPRMGCEEGRDDCPVTALPTILRRDGPTAEHFTTRYRKEFYCFACGFTNVTIHRNVLLSLTSTTSEFSMQTPTMHHPCPQCRAPGQISRIVYHSIPACPLVHFSHGLVAREGSSSLPRDFKHQGYMYHLTCVVQYKRDPDHFIIWIRDPAREMWLECNDLSSPLCHWTSQDPPIPPSQVHILGWEREGGHCKACVSLQEQMVEIQETPVPVAATGAPGDPASRMGATEGARMSGIGGSSMFAPVRKESRPVIVGRSPSPLTTAGNRLTGYKSAVGKSSLSAATLTARSIASRSVPGLLSIGTPPHSPEFSKTANTSPPGAKVNQQQSESASIQDIGAMWSNLKDKRSEPSNPKTPSSVFRDNIPYAIAKNFISEGTGNKPTRNTRGSLSRDFGKIPKQIMNWQQTKRDTLSPTRASSPDIGQSTPFSFSVAKMLRTLNPQIPPRYVKKKEQVGANAPPKGRPPTPPPKKIKRVRLPRRKYDTFCSFKQNAGKFSGYMKKDEEQGPGGGENGPGDQEKDDQYQSSVLLTPSSSVSSPSACSESSLHNENSCMATIMEQMDPRAVDDSSQDLSNTMDALCRALEITSQNVAQPVAQSSSKSSTFLDDFNFLEEMLR